MMSETRKPPEIQTVGQLLTDPHARREKGFEAEHDHEHSHDAAARVLRHRRLRKVDIYRRLFVFSLITVQSFAVNLLQDVPFGASR